jgi:predicted metalloprotease
MGPFYCPEDQRIYIDLNFFDTMANQLGAGGDFAQAYVISHEVGHHVQNLLGISERVNATRAYLPRSQANSLSVRVELQADCLAGVWAYHSQRSKGWLEQGDIEEAMNAATQIGDDTLQRKTRGTIVPESFTHGTSAQRTRWFTRGLQTGNMADCNTLGSEKL